MQKFQAPSLFFPETYGLWNIIGTKESGKGAADLSQGALYQLSPFW